VSPRATKLGKLLVGLYPEPWRERYGEELRALLEDDPPGARGLATLLSGAASAHLRLRRCWREGVPARTSMRLSVGALFACWMAISVAGSCFAKLTEHMDPLEHRHAALAAARAMITIGAGVGAAAVAIGGLPLVWHALRTAWRRRDRRLGWMLVSPAAAGALLLAWAAFLGTVSPSRGAGFPAWFVLGILLPLTLGTLACALVGAIAPKAVMRRAQPPAALLRLACWAGQALAAATVLVGAGLLLYVAGLWSAGGGTDASGPFGASTRATLVLALALTVPACAAALPASARARRAALADG
jgi:hypothetical protein